MFDFDNASPEARIRYLSAKRAMRSICGVSPVVSIMLGQMWERSLEIEPEGHGLMAAVEAALELSKGK